ncbi:MAG: RNA pseudouridine synthase, partial [Verrucomicrobiota bacterium]
MGEVIEREVPESLAGQRLDLAALRLFDDLDWSRSKIQSSIKSGNLRLDGGATKSKTIIEAGQIVSLVPKEEGPAELVAEDLDLQVIYEDEHLIVVDKAPGMVVHPGAGNSSGTLVNALLH